jgi:hypothetical protein
MFKKDRILWCFHLIAGALLLTSLSCLNVISENKELIPDNWYADPYFDRIGPLTGAGIDTWDQRDDLKEAVRPDLLSLDTSIKHEVSWRTTEQPIEPGKVFYRSIENPVGATNPVLPRDGLPPLSILNYGPTQDIQLEDGKVFSVSFNQPMVLPGELGLPRPSLAYAKIEPESQGYFVWYTQSSLSWVPTASLKNATDYRFVIRPNIAIGSGPTLSEEWSFDFFLDPLRVLEVHPTSGTLEPKISMPEARTYDIIMDRPVDPEYFKSFVQVSVNGQPRDFTLIGDQESEAGQGRLYRRMILSLKQEPTEQTRIGISFRSEGRAHENALAPLESKEVFFDTLDPFRIQKLSPENTDFPELSGRDIRYLFLETNQVLLEENALDRFQWQLDQKIVTPIEVLQRNRSVFFKLPQGEPGDRMILKVPKEFRDFYGRTLEGFTELSVILAPGRIEHSLPKTGNWIWPRHWDPTLPVTQRNLRAAALSWYKAADLYQGKLQDEIQATFNLEDQPFNSLRTSDLLSIPDSDSGTPSTWELRWNARLGGGGTGLPLNWEGGRFRIQRTQIGIYAKAAFDRILIKAYDLASVAPLSDATVRVYTQEETIFQGKIDPRGWAEFYLEPGFFSSKFNYLGRQTKDWIHIEISTGEDRAQLRIDPETTSGDASPFPFVYPDQSTQSRDRVYLLTDKTNYLYGQRIYFKGYHWEQNHQGFRPTRLEEATVALWRMPQNQLVAEQTVKPSFSGSFHQSFGVGRELPLGTYELRYTNGFRTLGRQRIVVGPGTTMAFPTSKDNKNPFKTPVAIETLNESHQIGDTLRLRGSHGLRDGRHILVVQQENILSYHEYRSTNPDIVIDMPLSKEHFPGITLSLHSLYPRIQDPQTGEILQESTSFTQEIALEVDSPVLDLDVQILNSRKHYTPSEEAYLGVRVTSDGFPISSAEVTLMVVPDDRPFLQHPNEFFYNHENFPFGVLETSTYHHLFAHTSLNIRNPSLIPNQSDNPVFFSGHSPEQTTLFFLPDIRCNKEGIASAQVSIPRNIEGNWKIIALVNKEGRFGLAEGPMILRPDIASSAQSPFLVNQRDRFPVTLSLRNNSNQEREVNVTVESTGLYFPHGQTLDAVIPAGGGHRFVFTGEALESGNFPIIFRDFGAGGSIYASKEIQVYPSPEAPGVYQKILFHQGEAQLGLFLPREEYSGTGEISLIVGNGPGLSLFPSFKRMGGRQSLGTDRLRTLVSLALCDLSQQEFLTPLKPRFLLGDLSIQQDSDGRVSLSTQEYDYSDKNTIPSTGPKENLNSLNSTRDQATLLMLHAHYQAERNAGQFRSKINLVRALNYLFQKGTTEIEERTLTFWDLWGYYILARARLITNRTLARFENQIENFGIAELSLLSRTYLVLGDLFKARQLYQKAKDYLSTSEGRVSFKVTYRSGELWRNSYGELGPFLSLTRLLNEPTLFRDAVRETLEDWMLKAEGHNDLEDFWSFASLVEDLPPFSQFKQEIPGDLVDSRISLGDSGLDLSIPLYQELRLSFNQEPFTELEPDTLRRLSFELEGDYPFRAIYQPIHSSRVEDQEALSQGLSLFHHIEHLDFTQRSMSFHSGQGIQRLILVDSEVEGGPFLLRIPKLPFVETQANKEDQIDNLISGQAPFSILDRQQYWELEIPLLPAGQTAFWQLTDLTTNGVFVLPPAEIIMGRSNRGPMLVRRDSWYE